MASKKNRRIWYILGGVVVIIILTIVFKKDDKGVKISTDKIALRNITEIVSANGKIQPEYEVKISADVSGEIIDMAVKEGDSVVAGQLLLRINPDIYESQVNQLAANLENGRAALAGNEAQKETSVVALEQAKSDFNRIKKLWDQKVVSEQEYEQARLKVETAKANLSAAEKNILASKYSVKSLEASMQQGMKNLGRTNIYAPASGIVTNLTSEKGERVVGTAQMAGTEIMRISNLSSMEVEVSVNENDILRVKFGDSADIHVDAWPDRTFRGIVTEIANSARFEAALNKNDQASNYVVKVRIIPENGKSGERLPFMSGMTASVDIRTVTRNQVLAVPIAAVTTRNPIKAEKASSESDTEKDQETKTWVFLFSDGKAKAVEVKTGIQDINYFEVLSGLKPGDEVISSPGMAIAKRINDGDKVQKVDKSKVFETE